MSPPSQRMAWIDNLRTLVIVLVVNMHACVTYSHVGSWYVNEPPKPPVPVWVAFLFWQAHLQSFFMGLLFFVAGIFAHRSLSRRGPADFVRERAIRLGLPSLLYMVLIHPFIVYVLLGQPEVPDRPSLGTLYASYLTSGRVFSGNGPLWFALALLVFCLMLAGWRTVRKPSETGGTSGSPAPGPKAILAFGSLVVVTTFAIRLAQPLGSSVLNFQLGYFPQYIAAFVAGVAAGRGGWLDELAGSSRARLAGWLGLAGGPVLLAALIAAGGMPPEEGTNPYVGGWHGQAFGLALWEQLTGLGLALGLVALYRARFNRAGSWTRWLSDRAFGVYVFHAPVLVALTPLLRPLKAAPLTNAALLTVLGVAASFAVTDVARRIPGFRAIL